MLARKCDRCKALYEPESVKIGKQKVNAIITIDRDTKNMYYSRDTIDLCPSCLKELEHWLNPKEN